MMCNIFQSTVRCSDIVNGDITYTPPRVVSSKDLLLLGQRFIGTIATYTGCSPGYQLVGMSSPIACGHDGRWNGTSCEGKLQSNTILFVFSDRL